MKFPIYDISKETWAKYKEHNIMFENPDSNYIKPQNRQKYLNKIRKHEYVDCNGDIYRITDFKFCKKTGISRYIPFFATIDFQFEKTGETCPFEKLKQLIIDRAVEDKDEVLENTARNVTSFTELLANNKVDFIDEIEETTASKRCQILSPEFQNSKLKKCDRKKSEISERVKERTNCKKRFIIISIIVFLIWILSFLILFCENNIQLFSKITFYLGVGVGIWFMLDDGIMRDAKLLFYSLFVGLIFFIYGFAIYNWFGFNGMYTAKIGIIEPLVMSVCRWSIGRIYLLLFKSKPGFRIGKSILANIVYSTILFSISMSLSFIIASNWK
jgi:hypothetical protein